jgi:hypothetical protein
MPQVHDIGKKHYWHLMKKEKTSPLYVTDVTQEIEPPFRKGSARVFRVPFTQHTIVWGTWTERLSETDALRAAIQAREMEYERWDWS